MLLPSFLLLLLVGRKLKKLKISHSLKPISKTLLCIALFLLLQIPVVRWGIDVSMTFGGSLPTFSLEYLKIKIPYMVGDLISKDVFFGMYAFNPIITLLFVFSCLFTLTLYFTKKDRMKVCFFIFFLLYFTLLFLFAGLYFTPGGKITGDYFRYMHSLVVPYSILSTSFLISVNKKKAKLVLVLVSSLLFLSTKLFGPTPTFTIFQDSRLDEPRTRNLILSLWSLPENSTVFISQSSVPSFDLVKKNLRWIDIELIPANNYRIVWEELNYSLSNNFSLYFIKDYRCTLFFDKNCRFIYENFNLTFHERIDNVEIYRLELKG